MSPKIDFPSPFLKALKDVNTGDIIRFLDAGEQDEKDNWIFTIKVEGKNLQKKFQLNKTNWKVISKEYGMNSDAWVNKDFEVTIIKTQNPQGELVDAIRLTIPNKDEDGNLEIG